MFNDLKFKVCAQFGRTDGSPVDFLDFTAFGYDAKEGVYVDTIDGIIWITGAGIDIPAHERGVEPVRQSMGVRWAEHTIMVSAPIVGAQVLVRLEIPGVPREMSMVGCSVGDASGISLVQLNAEDINIVLYQKEI